MGGLCMQPSHPFKNQRLELKLPKQNTEHPGQLTTIISA